MQVTELVERLGRAARVETYTTDTMLFRRGDPTRHMFGILEGQACLRRTTFEGAELIIHRAHEGDLFAEAALFSDAYHCDGQALAGSRVAMLSKPAVLNLMQDDGAFAEAFCQRLAGQVQRLRSNIELRAIRSADERIIAALSLRVGTGETNYELAGTWKGFAQEIGLSHEALYRALKRLELANRVQRQGRSIQLGV